MTNYAVVFQGEVDADAATWQEMTRTTNIPVTARSWEQQHRLVERWCYLAEHLQAHRAVRTNEPLEFVVAGHTTDCYVFYLVEQLSLLMEKTLRVACRRLCCDFEQRGTSARWAALWDVTELEGEAALDVQQRCTTVIGLRSAVMALAHRCPWASHYMEVQLRCIEAYQVVLRATAMWSQATLYAHKGDLNGCIAMLRAIPVLGFAEGVNPAPPVATELFARLHASATIAAHMVCASFHEKKLQYDRAIAHYLAAQLLGAPPIAKLAKLVLDNERSLHLRVPQVSDPDLLFKEHGPAARNAFLRGRPLEAAASPFHEP